MSNGYTCRYLSLHLCYHEDLWTSDFPKIVVACVSIKPVEAGLLQSYRSLEVCKDSLCGKYVLKCDQSASRKSRHNVRCPKVGLMTFNSIVTRWRTRSLFFSRNPKGPSKSHDPIAVTSTLTVSTASHTLRIVGRDFGFDLS
jgi:hypothetical protein